MNTFLGITGTTCVGKSNAAVQLAKMLKTEIISADSMQIYKGMDIGTAKISRCEMQGIKHSMLDIALPNQNFSSFQYQEQASKIIDNATNIPIVVGGTGFYFDSLLYPPEFGTVEPQRRKELQAKLDIEGLKSLQNMLRELDEFAYETIDINNPVRLLRAIEIAESGEKRVYGKGKREPKYNCILFVLQRDRKQLYQMIDERIDKMMELGLVEEVAGLIKKYGVCDTSAFSAIGYKEIIEYLQGNLTIEQAVSKIKLNTRHYAKRQITYFKKMNVFKFLDVDDMSCESVANDIYNECRSAICE